MGVGNGVGRGVGIGIGVGVGVRVETGVAVGDAAGSGVAVEVSVGLGVGSGCVHADNHTRPRTTTTDQHNSFPMVSIVASVVPAAEAGCVGVGEQKFCFC